MTLPQTPLTIKFFSPYTPGAEELSTIQNALLGWPHDSGIIAPSYYPDKAIEDAVLALIKDDAPLSENIIDLLTERKLSVLNFHYFILKQPLQQKTEAHLADTREFFRVLNQELNVSRDFFKQRFGFTANYLDFLAIVMAKTAPMFFFMAYPDAASHPAQVSLQCVIEASKRDAHDLELLQAACVGWMHDPKLDSVTMSWSNLATHPIIGSTIALNILNQEDIIEHLNACISETPDQNPNPQEVLNQENFIRGIVEALSINNDSRFVLENAILKKPPFASVGSEDGLAQQLEFTEAQALIYIAEERFRAPARGKFPPLIPKDLIDSLESTSLGTGLRGIKASTLEAAVKEVINPDTSASDIYAQIIAGKIDQETANKLVDELDEYKKSIIDPQVKGISLFSHHEEVCPSGRQAAYALAVSDPSQLSLHKVIELKQAPTVLEMIHTFTKGFEDNMTYLPKDAVMSSRLWQRDMYLSIIEAADTLTGKRYQEKAKETLNLDERENYTIVCQDINQLQYWINDAKTWQSADNSHDFAHLHWENPDKQADFNMLLQTLKETYLKALGNNLNTVLSDQY